MTRARSPDKCCAWMGVRRLNVGRSSPSESCIMGRLLQKAVAEASKLPEADQEAVGAWLLAELESERRWDDSSRSRTTCLRRWPPRRFAKMRLASRSLSIRTRCEVADFTRRHGGRGERDLSRDEHAVDQRGPESPNAVDDRADYHRLRIPTAGDRHLLDRCNDEPRHQRR